MDSQEAPPPPYSAVGTTDSRIPQPGEPSRANESQHQVTSRSSGSHPEHYPPPPGLAHEFSSGANASADEAEWAIAWCRQYPLWGPQPLGPAQQAIVHSQELMIQLPTKDQAPGFSGTINLKAPEPNTFGSGSHKTFIVTTTGNCKDSLLQTMLPAYSAIADRPRYPGQEKTIYYEIRILGLGTREYHRRLQEFNSHHHSGLRGMFHSNNAPEIEAGVAIGFIAPPYPCFRLPGWERGSLAVHSDDGRRYVGNNKGGVEFAEPFQEAETLGIGMTFRCMPQSTNPAYDPLDVQIFMTRGGRRIGGWHLRNTDGNDENVEGLLGENDLFPAIGVFGEVEIEVEYMETGWRFKPGASQAY